MGTGKSGMAAISTEDSFQKVLSRLREGVVIGKAHLRIGRGLSDALAKDTVIGHVAKVFWGTTVNAHLDAAQLLAFKLFDSRRGSMTIEYLLEFAETSALTFKAHPDRVPALFTSSRGQIAAIEAELKPLKAKRNRIMAHWEPTIVLAPEKLAASTKVTFANLEKIFSTAVNILNGVTAAYRDSFSDYELLDVDDYTWALQLIADAKHEQYERFEREFKKAPDFPRPTTPRTEW